MAIIDDKTPNLQLPLPNASNLLSDDVARIRTSFTALDSAMPNKADLVAGKIPSAQLPSFVDDVIEVANFAALPATGETGKIYVLLTPNTVNGSNVSEYRWGGSVYVPIVSSPGTTDAVAEGTTNLYFTAGRVRGVLATQSQPGAIKPGAGCSVDAAGALNIDGAGQTFQDVILPVTTQGQTSFTATYTPGAIDVYLNGAKLVGNGDDFTATSGTGITLTVGANTTDTLILRTWATFNVANAATLSGAETLTNKTLVAPVINENVQVINANTLAAVSRTYVLAASLTLTLPLTPTAGQWVAFSNRSGTTTCVIARNGQPIMGLAEDMTIDNVNYGGTLVYADATRGWVFQ